MENRKGTMVEVREIKAKNIISKSGLGGAEYSINPYVGCTHSCIYCYARYMKRFTGHEEPWGSFVDVKSNACELMPQDGDKYRGKDIFLSSVTDAYQPLERKYELTRKILEKLVPLGPKICIQTKSDLVLRDMDVLKKFRECEIGMTITSLDDNLRKEIEPYASSVQGRLNALKTLKENGFRTYVFIGPIMPYLTDWKKIIGATREWADGFMFEDLTVRGSIWHPVRKWLVERHPELLGKYEDIYLAKSGYWDGVENEIREFCEKEKLEYRMCFHH